MLGTIQSSKQLMSLKKTEEIRSKMREGRGRFEPRQAPCCMLLSPVSTAHNPALSA